MLHTPILACRSPPQVFPTSRIRLLDEPERLSAKKDVVNDPLTHHTDTGTHLPNLNVGGVYCPFGMERVQHVQRHSFVQRLSIESNVTTSASFFGQSSTRYQSVTLEGNDVVGERVGELSEVKFMTTVMALVDLASGRSGDFRRRIKSESKTERRFSSDELRALLTLGGLLADEYYLSNEKNINL